MRFNVIDIDGCNPPLKAPFVIFDTELCIIIQGQFSWLTPAAENCERLNRYDESLELITTVDGYSFYRDKNGMYGGSNAGKAKPTHCAYASMGVIEALKNIKVPSEIKQVVYASKAPIEVEMTWEKTLPALLLLLENGSDKAKCFARSELFNMACAADK